jgi:hypothetical protein
MVLVVLNQGLLSVSTGRLREPHQQQAEPRHRFPFLHRSIRSLAHRSGFPAALQCFYYAVPVVDGPAASANPPNLRVTLVEPPTRMGKGGCSVCGGPKLHGPLARGGWVKTRGPLPAGAHGTARRAAPRCLVLTLCLYSGRPAPPARRQVDAPPFPRQLVRGTLSPRLPPGPRPRPSRAPGITHLLGRE